MAVSNTSIINMALGKIGSKRINNFDDTSENNQQSIQARLHFEQTRDSLIRSHFWRFASARKTLSQDTVDPDFEWSAQFILPTDFMRMKSVFSDNSSPSRNTRLSYALEGDRLLTNESSMNIRYIKKVTDPTQFDSLFIEVLVLQLALKFVAPLSGSNPKLQELLERELIGVMRRVRTIDRQETNTTGREDLLPWNDARSTLTGRIDSQLGS